MTTKDRPCQKILGSYSSWEHGGDGGDKQKVKRHEPHTRGKLQSGHLQVQLDVCHPY